MLFSLRITRPQHTAWMNLSWIMILECLKERTARLFWPVFYDLEPSHRFGTKLGLMQKLWPNMRRGFRMMRRTRCFKGREALSKAANMVGWHFQHRYITPTPFSSFGLNSNLFFYSYVNILFSIWLLLICVISYESYDPNVKI